MEFKVGCQMSLSRTISIALSMLGNIRYNETRHLAAKKQMKLVTANSDVISSGYACFGDYELNLLSEQYNNLLFLSYQYFHIVAYY